MGKSKGENRRVAERRLPGAEIVLQITPEKLTAQLVDISATGIKVETENPLRIRLQLDDNGNHAEYEAQLVWVKEDEGGRMTYGLRYGMVNFL